MKVATMSENREKRVTRRNVLKTGAGGAMGGWLAAAGLTGSEGRAEDPMPNVYDTLGVKPFINAAGTITTMGGSIMPPEVVAAWQAASRHFVDLRELQDRVGERIAELCRVEAALVTTGAAGAILLGTAAAVTHRDEGLIACLPVDPALGLQVVSQKSHRLCYDRQVEATGAKIIEVETRAELEAVLDDKTVMMMAYNVRETAGKIKRQEWIEVARKNNIPTLLDAAADTPPVDALWKYNDMGYDLVVFSGGKALRGPQDGGLLLGRKNLIEAAKRNTSPYCPTIGRGMKVSKEDMVAMWAAVERFVGMDASAEWREWERRIEAIESSLQRVPTVTTQRIVPPIANSVPHLLVFWDENELGISRSEVTSKLRDGEPSIRLARVSGTGSEGLLISVFMLQPGEDKIIGDRLRQILSRE